MEDNLSEEQLRARFHRKPDKETMRNFKIRNILNIVFILLAILTAVIYFVKPLPEGLPYFFICATAAIAVKMVEAYLRLSFNKKHKENDKR